jgi:WD40 repeat protein
MVDAEIPSLAAKVRPIEAGGLVVAAAFLGETPAFALGEGEILLAGDSERRVATHGGAILETVGDGARLFTAGDDGRVVATGADGAAETLVEAAGRWIEHIALGPGGAFAWSAGKSAFVRASRGERSLDLPSSVGGLAFAPKGLRLAVAHYNGATLWFPNATEAKPETLAWKGSHLGTQFSPDGRFLITSMQEPALHGWRVADGQHMRMTGYPARVRSMSFSSDGKWLATSGANEVILWPFDSKEGPTGKRPRTLAQHSARVAVIACHPREPLLVAGYADGLGLLVRLADGAAILVRQPEGSPVSALAWRADGKALAFGTEDGKAGVLIL